MSDKLQFVENFKLTLAWQDDKLKFVGQVSRTPIQSATSAP
jgi:hypothetical protein